MSGACSAYWGERVGLYRALVGKREGRRPLGRPKCRWEDNIKMFLISNVRRVLNAVCFLLGNSPASEFYMPTFRNTLFHIYPYPPLKAGRDKEGTNVCIVVVVLLYLSVYYCSCLVCIVVVVLCWLL